MAAAPKYLELARELESAIASGRLKPGHKLPSVRETMQQYGISLATVVSAYRSLEERGLTEARPKSGYFVVEHKPRSLPHTRVENGTGGVVVDCVESLAASGLFPQQRLQRLMATAVRQLPRLAISPGTLKGHDKLRGEIARRSAEFGLFVRADDVFITQGAWEALRLCLQAVASPGDAIAVESPCHPRFLSLLATLGFEVVELETLTNTTPLHSLLEGALEQYPQLRAALIMPTFHPATGALMPVPNKRRLQQLAQQRELALIEFDALGDLQHEGPRPPPVKAFDPHGWVLYCGSFSNIVAPGLPVGWAAPGRWAERFQALKHDTGASQCELPQVVIHDYLRAGSHRPHLRRMRQALQERMQTAQRALQACLPEGCQWTRPAGAYYLWLQLPMPISADTLHDQLAAAPSLFAPGSRFSNSARYQHCLRLNVVGAPPQALEEAIQRLGQACKQAA